MFARFPDDERFFGREPLCRLEKLYSIGHGLQVYGDSAGLRIIGKIIEGVGVIHIEPVAVVYLLGDPDAVPGQRLHEDHGDRSALGYDGEHSGARSRYPFPRDDETVEAVVGIEDAEGIRSDHPDPVLSRGFADPLLQTRAFFSRLRESRADKDDPAYALVPELTHHLLCEG